MRKNTKILNFKITAIAVFLLIPFLFQGCGQKPEEIEEKILVHDPSFQDTLDARDSLRSELNAQKMDFLNKEQKLNDEIRDIKKKKTKLSNEYTLRVGKIKEQIQPKKQQLKEELLTLKRRYALQKEKIKQADNDIN
ncbi:MAG: hypothetical protein HQ594_07100, partial [Candidatus Omnitrophica bacterium]|nr:hypothetical protein [Candidatus Omnitrophota bacterium]